MTVVVGADAARLAGRAGWVAVRLDSGRLDSLAFHEGLADVVAASPEAVVVGVDVPVGHDDPRGTGNNGRRACDVAAQQALGGRGASVFMVPPPAVLRAPDHEAAVLLARRLGVIAPSAQLWAVRERVLEAEAVSARDPRVREVHPELAFLAMAQATGGKAPTHGKTTPAGRTQRLALLHALGLRPQRSTGGVGGAQIIADVLDATAAAWTAGRIARGDASSLPAEPAPDPVTGRPVAIWA